MTFQHFNRRLHLYLAMFLLPWFIIYGVSSAPFSHPTWFRNAGEGRIQWLPRFDKPYAAEFAPGTEARVAAAQVLRENGLDGAYGANWVNPRQLNIFMFSFLSATRLSYHLDQKRLVAEDRPSEITPILTGIHARGGFEQPLVMNDLWGVVVDIVCIGFLLWIATGIYMWWHLPSTRVWGWVALIGGAALFAIFLVTL